MDREQFIKILCWCQSLMVALKNEHWVETQSSNKHQILDALHGTLDTFVDGFAEDGIITFGPIGHNEIIPFAINETEDDLVQKVYRFAKEIKAKLNESDNEIFDGMKGITDTLIHDCKINVYRWQMN